MFVLKLDLADEPISFAPAENQSGFADGRSTHVGRFAPAGGRRDLLVVAVVFAVLAAALAYAARGVWRQPAEVAPTSPSEQRPVEASPAKPAKPPSDLIDDDGRTLWVSPTDGRPLDLAYLPPGVEIVLALRPAELLAHPEGEKVLAALGPAGAAAQAAVERSTGTNLREIERLLVGWQVEADGSYVATLVVTGKSPLRPAGDFYQPKSGQGRMTVIAPPSALADIRTLDGHPPPLLRDLERILSHTDAARQVTLLMRPRALLNDRSQARLGEAALLRRPLERLLGDNIAAAALSMNWGKNFFVELVAMPTLDSSPAQMADGLARRVDELPDLVEDFTLSLDASPYGRRVVARLPEMTRKLAAYTRHGFDRDSAVLRCYLPAVAGHNLLMGAELALAEGQGGAGPVATTLAAAPRPPIRLRRG